MKNCNSWKGFIITGKIDDYLHYIACTQEESMEELLQVEDKSMPSIDSTVIDMPL